MGESLIDILYLVRRKDASIKSLNNEVIRLRKEVYELEGKLSKYEPFARVINQDEIETALANPIEYVEVDYQTSFRIRPNKWEALFILEDHKYPNASAAFALYQDSILMANDTKQLSIEIARRLVHEWCVKLRKSQK